MTVWPFEYAIETFRTPVLIHYRMNGSCGREQELELMMSVRVKQFGPTSYEPKLGYPPLVLLPTLIQTIISLVAKQRVFNRW